MCFSSSTLFFGITLQALDLCIAGVGYETIKPALLAVNFVRTRKIEGTLETSTPGRRATVCSLPIELWDLIEFHIMRQSYLDSYNCFKCHYNYLPSDDDRDDGIEARRDDELTFANALGDGNMAIDLVLDMGGVPQVALMHEPFVINMLESFGLCLISGTLISDEESVYSNFEASWAIGIPLVRDGDKAKAYPDVRTHIPHESDATHKLYRISPSTVVLPADADSRFRRLLSSFPALVPTSHTTGTIRPPSPSSTSLEAPQGKAAGEERTAKNKLSKEERRERDLEKKRAARVPGWMLVASGSSCSW